MQSSGSPQAPPQPHAAATTTTSSSSPAAAAAAAAATARATTERRRWPGEADNRPAAAATTTRTATAADSTSSGSGGVSWEDFLITHETLLQRVTAAPITSACLALVCLVSFFYGTLGMFDRALLRATGSSAPIRIPLFGPFTSTSDANSGDASDSSADAALVTVLFRFLFQYVNATFIVPSSGELAVVCAAVYAFVMDLERCRLGSTRLAALLAAAVLLRMAWVAVTHGGRKWWMWLPFSSSSPSQLSGHGLDEGLRPGPAWVCLTLLIVYEKTRRAGGGGGVRGGGYEAIPGVDGHTAAGEAAEDGGRWHDETHLMDRAGPGPLLQAPTTTTTPPVATATPSGDAGSAATNDDHSGDVRSPPPSGESAHPMFPYPSVAGPDGGPLPAARVKLFGKIPVTAGLFRAFILLHLLLRLEFIDEVIPAVILGLVL